MKYNNNKRRHLSKRKTDERESPQEA